MSVMAFTKQDLESLAASIYTHLKAAEYQTWKGYTIEDAYRVMAVAGIANRTASFLTYEDRLEDDWEDVRFLEDAKPTLDAKETYKQISSLLYNCVSNGGTDCIPKKYRDILEDMARCIIEAAAGWR